ncbi:cytochrome P450 [Irpex rosettiformis]|uniref:Cytochrome P450 n=1 Tax=Irpex rosettiformis TaxID=378272 RepID=A0ACB8TWL7_9APHY|nr:cytochrome P450 [Irpex rosettiformis]
MFEDAYGRLPTTPISLAAVTLCMALVVCAIGRYYLQLRSHGPLPTVWPVIPIIGDAFQFLYTPLQYYQSCRSKYGSVFRCLIGNRRMIVICDDVAIQGVLRDKSRILSTTTIHEDVSAALLNVSPTASRYLPDILLPMSGDLLSMTGLVHIIPALNRSLHNYVERIKLSANSRSNFLLSTFVGEAIYGAVSVGVFGDNYPLSTFFDFESIDANFTNLLSGIPFLSRSSKSSRSRILAKVGEYIDDALRMAPRVTSMQLPDPAQKLLAILSDPDLSKKDRDGLLVMYIWGLHSSNVRTAFWLFAYLLNDPATLRLVRDEIDQTLSRDFPDFDSLLNAPPGVLDGPGFAYLTSAVKETLRMSSVITPVREVVEDTFITLSTGETMPLRKGEFITANLPMYHYSESDSPCNFRADRYLVGEKSGKKVPYMPWGSGEHVCKGRFLAIHTLKMFTIMVLRSLDLSAVTKTGQPLTSPYLRGYETTFMQRWQMRTHTGLSLYIRPSIRSQVPSASQGVLSDEGNH